MSSTKVSKRQQKGITPMIAQWYEAKEAYPDCLLFFRMGDFYELFFDDAVIASENLDIALTKRGHQDGQPIPMAGVPFHSAEQYLPKLITAGYRVAVVEQVEQPEEARKRGAKSLVRREVVRVVTPGTLTEDVLLDAKTHNYLAAVSMHGAEIGLAWLDISTGEVWLQSLGDMNQAALQLPSGLARLDPSEVILSDSLHSDLNLGEVWEEWKAIITKLPDERFDFSNGEKRLAGFYNVVTLEAFGDPGKAAIASAGALFDYLSLTQIGQLPRLAFPSVLPPPGSAGAVMEIDPATRRNLELTKTIEGNKAGSLLATIDRTLTSVGARLLSERLSSPVTDVREINSRLDSVSFFIEASDLRKNIQQILKECPDMGRSLSRLSLGRGGPRDLATIRQGLKGSGSIAKELSAAKEFGSGNSELSDLTNALVNFDILCGSLDRALSDSLPVLARDGGFIASGYSDELDGQTSLRDDSRRTIAELQKKYSEETGVSLKIKHNNILGYFVEIPTVQAERLIAKGKEGVTYHHGLIHRQTMTTAIRFSTIELSELEEKITLAAERALGIELEIFSNLVKDIMSSAKNIDNASRAIASIDLSLALAELAVENNYNRPKVDNSEEFFIVQGRHPVVESALEQGYTDFIPNDCNLSGDEDGGRLWLLTGPNMAGKSTFLRQNALIALLAQIGSFVPAVEARIGVVDRLFSRVGAADDLARGRSTFMVEMVETAAILNRASRKSLVILDEIGRGTATFDGLSIAWASIEHLHDINQCRTLFATHFHELTNLSTNLSQLSCRTMRTKEWRDDLVFMHEVIPGASDRSYGIHVGRLAGLPSKVLTRAEEVLGLLESADQENLFDNMRGDLPLFSASHSGDDNSKDIGIERQLRSLLDEIEVEETTPRSALDILYRLKAILDD